ncbi:Retrovirus-related Pol polyprotein from transposon TNT 1-94 [Eumeta japonica]|uniref:Retrovirus-related Pol polyprotein from transposon TNT 1-94 n=1 Tax=Eumeta variegata TaxID=151549 RepID=A0A4C1Z7H0_EUMVA|nr:Retrovirus-related Pol polyprotein from transposon TNT 1-94 [Eumeta japonica]
MDSTQGGSGQQNVMKLEGSRNWNVWKFQTSVLLRGQGLYKIVDGTTVKPEDDTQRSTWETQDARAQTLIVTRMTEEVMLHIISCDTAAAMWRKLLSVYEQKSETSIHIVQQRFFQFKFEEGTEMSVFIKKDYKHFISAWESAPDDKQTYDNLVARLLIEEERIKETNAVYGVCGKEITKSQWLVDSGASEHMCCDYKLFNSYSTVKDKSVIVGNGTKINVKGCGQVALQVWNGSEWIDTTIDNVLHVPELKTNLFSVNCATSRGYVIVTEENKCKFYKQNKVMAIAERRGSMYYLDFRYFNAYTANLADVCCDLREWHEKLVHQNIVYVKDVLKKNNINIKNANVQTCESCLKGKIHRLPYPVSNNVTSRVCEIIHADTCGPMEKPSIGGSRYFVVFKDEYSKYRRVFFVKTKDEIKSCIKNFISQAENETGNKIKIFRSDNGTEFINKENGVAERENRILVEAARTMLYAKDLPISLWAESVNTAAYKSEVETKRDIVFVNNSPVKPIQQCETINYIEDSVEVPATVEVGAQVEDTSAAGMSSPQSPTMDGDDSQHTMQSDSEGSVYEPSDSDECGEVVRRDVDPKNKRIRKQTVFYNCNNVMLDNCEPKTYCEAMNSPDACKWQEAIQRELKTLKDNNTWSICDIPDNEKVISSKWVFKIKRNNSNIQYKARLVARGLVYKCDDSNLVGFCDADWEGPSRQEVHYWLLLHVFNCLISWCSKKQSTVSLSSAESEYVAMSMAGSEACWIANVLCDFNESKIVGGVPYATFLSACQTLNLSDQQWDKCIHDTYNTAHPNQDRRSLTVVVQEHQVAVSVFTVDSRQRPAAHASACRSGIGRQLYQDYHISRECEKPPATMPSRSRPTPTGTNAGRPACVCAAEHARRAPRFAPRPRPACYFSALVRPPRRLPDAEVYDAPRAYHAADGGAPPDIVGTITGMEPMLGAPRRSEILPGRGPEREEDSGSLTRAASDATAESPVRAASTWSAFIGVRRAAVVCMRRSSCAAPRQPPLHNPVPPPDAEPMR